MEDLKINKEDFIGYLVNRAAKNINVLFDKAMEHEKEPIRIEQWRLLINLMESDFIYQKDITVCIDRDKTYVTRMLEGMQEQNWICRHIDKKDKRNYKVKITPKGEEYIRKMFPEIKKKLVDEMINNAFNEDELQTFKSYLKRLNLSIENCINDLAINNE